eukprot:scaffold38437_cov21-Prasinocladus_malaysianus.AAC.1
MKCPVTLESHINDAESITNKGWYIVHATTERYWLSSKELGTRYTGMETRPQTAANIKPTLWPN